MFFTHGPTILQAWLLFYRIYNKHHVPGTHSELGVKSHESSPQPFCFVVSFLVLKHHTYCFGAAVLVSIRLLNVFLLKRAGIKSGKRGCLFWFALNRGGNLCGLHL